MSEVEYLVSVNVVFDHDGPPASAAVNGVARLAELLQDSGGIRVRVQADDDEPPNWFTVRPEDWS